MTEHEKIRKGVSHIERIESEKVHGRKIASNAQKIWHWEGRIGSARYQRRAKYLSQGLRQGIRCLEIGCGTGLFTKDFAETGAHMIAVDISYDLLAETRNRSLPVEIIEADICRLPFANECFDAVVGSSILHHLDTDLGLKEIYRVLKKNGQMRFTEPNYLNPHVFLERKIPFLRNRFGVSKYETAFIRWELKKKLASNGFKDVVVEPFDFLYPFLPGTFLGFLEGVSGIFERIPILREIAGSLQITANK